MIKKEFLKSRPVCKTTFSLSPEELDGAKQVGVVGEFNNWDLEAPIEMTKKKNGNYTATVELPLDKQVQFRYVLDGKTWANESSADAYAHTPFGSENSVVHTQV